MPLIFVRLILHILALADLVLSLLHGIFGKAGLMEEAIRGAYKRKDQLETLEIEEFSAIEVGKGLKNIA